MDEYELLGDGTHHSPPLHPACVASITTSLCNAGLLLVPCKLLLQSQKCVCRCIYDLFTFRAYLLDVHGRRGILDKLDTAVCEKSDNSGASVAARKNKTHCMTNTHVIHSQSMEELESMEYSTNHILARFIRLLYPQKIFCTSRSDPRMWVMLHPCTYAKSEFSCSVIFQDSGTAMTGVWKALTLLISPFPQLKSRLSTSSSTVPNTC